MKNLLYLSFLFLFVGCNGQENLEFKKAEDDFKETGLLNATINKPLKIYASPTNNKAIGKITFDRALNGSIEVNSSLEEKLNPYAKGNSSSYLEAEQLINMGLAGYSHALKFRVLSFTPEYFEVLVNDDTKEIGYIKKEEDKENHLRYTTWEEYLKKAEMIVVKNCNIYDKANGNEIDTINYRGHFFKVADVQEDWLYGIPPYQLKSGKSGWIKWRENGNLMIQVIEYVID